jgi:predicted RecA/RadA family phage recombinase
MATNFIASGEILQYTAGSDIDSGDVVVMGSLVGVALTDIASGSSGSVQVEGVFSLPKKSADTLTLGEKVYWDAVTNGGEITETATSNTFAGYVYEAAAASTTSVKVKLHHI